MDQTQESQCWNCGTNFNSHEHPSWPYCPNCAQPAWDTLTNSQREKIADAHQRLLNAWQESQDRIGALEEQTARAEIERDKLQQALEDASKRQKRLQDGGINPGAEYVANLEAELVYYKQNFIELRDWMAELVDERDRAVTERNYYWQQYSELRDKEAALEEERNKEAWERDYYRDHYLKLRDQSNTLTEERDKAFVERDYYKDGFLKLHDEIAALTDQLDRIVTERDAAIARPGAQANGRRLMNPRLLQKGDRVQAFTGNWGTIMVQPQRGEWRGWRVGIALDDGGYYIELPPSFFDVVTRGQSVLWAK